MAHKLSKIESEFLLKASMQSSLPVRVHGSGRVLISRIREIKADRLVLELNLQPEKPMLAWDKLACYLDYHGQILNFKTTVREIEGRRISVLMPDTVYKDIKRAHVRVPCPRSCSVEVFLASDRFKLDYPECPEYSDVALPENPAKSLDLSSMNALVASFREKAITEANENRIVMFKGRKPETHEEKLLVRYGKALYIPSTRSSLPESDPYPEGRLVTRCMEEDFEGSDFFTEGSEMERRLADKKAKGVHAEIWAPVHYYQYVVGYVYLANTGVEARPLTADALDFAWEFSRVLAYYLKTHNYFDVKENDAPTPYQGKVIDMSLSGMLLELPSSLLSVKLRTRSALMVKIAHQELIHTVNGIVARRFDDKASSFYGISFCPMSEDAERDLTQLLYGCGIDGETRDERDFKPAAGQ